MKKHHQSGPFSAYTREQKIIMAAGFFFRHKNFVSPKNLSTNRGEITDTAILNYYSQCRSINELCTSNTALFFVELALKINDPLTSLEQKIETIVLQYIDLLFENPDFAMAVLHELLSENKSDKTKNARIQFVLNSLFMKQLFELKNKKIIKPISLLMNLVGMVLLPLTIKNDGFDYDSNLNNTQLKNLIEEQKKFLPIWISART